MAKMKFTTLFPYLFVKKVSCMKSNMWSSSQSYDGNYKLVLELIEEYDLINVFCESRIVSGIFGESPV